MLLVFISILNLHPSTSMKSVEAGLDWAAERLALVGLPTGNMKWNSQDDIITWKFEILRQTKRWNAKSVHTLKHASLPTDMY